MSNKKSEIEAFLAEAAEQAPKTEAVFPIREKMKAEFDTLYNGYIIESYNEGIEGEYGAIGRVYGKRSEAGKKNFQFKLPYSRS